MSLTFHCPTCGAPLDPPARNEAIMRCPFCQSSVIVPEEIRQQSRRSNTLSREQVLANLPGSSQQMMEIIKLIKNGQKEDAVSMFRTAFNSSRTDAVATVEAIEQGQIISLSHLKMGKQNQETEGSLRNVPRGPVSTIRKSRIPALIGIGCLSVGLLVVGLALVGILIYPGLRKPGSPFFSHSNAEKPFERMTTLYAFGEEGLMPGQLSKPESIAVDYQGNIFVADLSTGRIQQFDGQGNFMRLWDASDDRLIIWDLEVDQNGILYAAAERNILRYDTKSGEILSPIPNPENFFFYDLYILSDGSIGAVVEGETLIRMQMDGSIIWRVDDVITKLANRSDSNTRLTVDGNNNFYLAGSFVRSVFKFSPQGVFLNRWGSEGEEPGQFDTINSIAIDHNGRLVVDDLGEFEIFDLEGRFIEQIDYEHVIRDIQFDSSGKLYAVNNNKVQVIKINDPLAQ
jgi:uncharacterized Zn finger protein (UPF0148 family)